MTEAPTPEEVAALVKRLRDTPNWKREGFRHWKDNISAYDRAPFEAADMLEALSRRDCPLGEDCDLTVAWMAGASRARDEGWNAAIEAAAKAAEAYSVERHHSDEVLATLKGRSLCDPRRIAAAIRALRCHEGEKP